MTGHGMPRAGSSVHHGCWVCRGLDSIMWALRETFPADNPSSSVAVIPFLPQASLLYLAPEAKYGGRPAQKTDMQLAVPLLLPCRMPIVHQTFMQLSATMGSEKGLHAPVLRRKV